MKREIKFRAWHKGQKEMFTALYLTFSGRIGIWNNEETEIDFTSEYPYLELMQYTGLKDKNGKEIYEGDILNTKTTFENNMSDRRFQPDTERLVSFENGGFIDKYTGRELWDKIRNLTYTPSRWTDYEIIGNIYENPELI